MIWVPSGILGKILLNKKARTGDHSYSNRGKKKADWASRIWVNTDGPLS